jgi:hypothetical protein
MLRNNLNRNKNETKVELKKSIDDFCKIDNKIKFTNILNHSCNMINDCGLKKMIQSKQIIILLNKK